MLDTLEVGAIAISLGLLSLYHAILYLGVVTGKAPNIQLSMNIHNATSWVNKHKMQGDAPNVTLAVQTMRNTILVAIFLGGNALTYAFDFTNTYKEIEGDLMKVRTIIISTLLFCSFLCWACVIRFASHLGYTIGTLSYGTSGPAHTAQAPAQGPAGKQPKQAKQAGPAPAEAPAGAPSDTAPGATAPPTGSAPGATPGAAAGAAAGAPEAPRVPGAGALVTTENDYQPIHTEDITSAAQRQRSVEEECVRKSQLIMVFFSLGFRFMFIALPFAFLSMGAVGLVISTGVLLIFLYFYDY